MSDRAASAAELRADLSVDKKDKNHKTKRAALRKVIVNMTINNTDMINLFNEIVSCMAVDDLEIKKMCFLYLETYAKSRPHLAANALDVLETDLDSSSPLVRALALRTASSVPLKPFAELTCKRSLSMLKDKDAYVRKTAVYAVAKAWSADPKGPRSDELLKSLNHMLVDQNPSVVAAAVAALNELTSHHKSIVLTIDEFTVFQFAKILPECNEWSQVYLLNAIMDYVPQSSEKAIRLVKLLMPRLKHANAAVITAAMRTLLFLSNYAAGLEAEVPRFGESIDRAILLLLAKPAEIQYVMLRNCIMLLQHRPDLLHLSTAPFVIKSADPVYIKISKIEVLLLLSSPERYGDVVFELESCIGQDDETTSRRAIKTIGRLAIKIPEAAESCVRIIMRNALKGTDYNAQEGIVAMLQILRRYPDKFVHVIEDIVRLKDTIWPDDRARTVFIWVCGQYPSIVQDAPAILTEECNTAFAPASSLELQLTLLTAAIKLFLAYPVRAKMLIPRIFEIATTSDTSPDVRDRAFMYWRLLSADAGKTRDIITAKLPAIKSEDIVIDEACLEELELCLGYLSTVYLKPAASLFRIAKPMKLGQSPALLPRQTTTTLRKNAPPPTPTRPQSRMSRQHSILFTQPPRPSLSGPSASFGRNQPADSPALESLNEFENDNLIDI